MTLLIVIVLALGVVLAITESSRISAVVDGAESRLHVRLAGLEAAIKNIETKLTEKL